MPMFTEPIRVRQLETLDEFPSPLMDTLGASASQALYDSPTSQLYRTYEDWQAERPNSPRLDFETARTRAREAGVDVQVPPEGINEGALNLLIERKRNQTQRDDTINRGPSGVVAGTAQFVTGLAASMLDPINLAASFIPVARPLGMAAQLDNAANPALSLAQRSVARAQVGAVEGVVGQAVVEPLTAYRANVEQQDYELSDTLRNLLFGGILGSTAHVTLGGVADVTFSRKNSTSNVDLKQAMAQVDPAISEAAFSAKLAAAVQGRDVDVTPVLKIDPELKGERPQPAATEWFSGASRSDLTTLDPAFGSDKNIKGRGVYVSKDYEFSQTYARGSEGGAGRVYTVDFETKNPFDEDKIFTAAEAKEYWAAAGMKPQEIKDLLGLKQKVSGTTIYKELTKKLGNANKASELLQARGHDMLMFKKDGKQLGVVFSKLDVRQDPPNRVREADMDAVKRAAQQSAAPEADVHANFSELSLVDELAKKESVGKDDVDLIRESVAEIESDVNQILKQMKRETKELDSYNEMVSQSAKYAKAVEAAAICGVRG